MIISRTPYRISFYGGGSDYPCWFKKHGGAVLGTTIDKYCWIGVRKPSPFGPKFKLVYSRVEECDFLDRIEHPAIRETLRYLGIEGVTLYHWNDLPARSGMGSSSAFVVGLVNALLTLLRKPSSDFNNMGIPYIAINIEQQILKETVGNQDQLLTFHGGFRTFEWTTNNHLPTGLLLQPSTDTKIRLENNLLLFYTGVQRTSSDVAASYISNLEQPHTARLMTETADLVHKGVGHLNRGELDDFGFLLDKAWEVKKQLSPNISTPKIDSIYAKAKKAGALGGKLLGAGGGGFFLFYVPAEKHAAVREALKNLIEAPFRFEPRGSMIVYEGE